MSKPAAIPPEPASEEAIAAAVGHANRRLWLLEMIIALSMALLRAMNAGGTAGTAPFRIAGRAYVAISRVVRLGLRIHAETERLLRGLKAGILPPPAPAAEPSDAERLIDHEPRESFIEREALDREVFTESDKAFRARLEALETLLDQDALAISGKAPRDTAQILCRAFGFDPAWIGWLGDDWIDANLRNLSPPAGGSTGEAGEGGPRRPPPGTDSEPEEGVRQASAPLHPPPPPSLSSGRPLIGPGGEPPPPSPSKGETDCPPRRGKRARRRERGRRRGAEIPRPRALA